MAENPSGVAVNRSSAQTERTQLPSTQRELTIASRHQTRFSEMADRKQRALGVPKSLRGPLATDPLLQARAEDATRSDRTLRTGLLASLRTERSDAQECFPTFTVRPASPVASNTRRDGTKCPARVHLSKSSVIEPSTSSELQAGRPGNALTIWVEYGKRLEPGNTRGR